MFDRPCALLAEVGTIVVEWEWREGEDPVVVAEAVQVFLDSGIELGDREVLDPPFCTVASRDGEFWRLDFAEVERYTFRLPVRPVYLERLALLPSG